MDIPQQLQPLICKALVDDAFRAALLKDPQGAARELGIELPPRYIEHFSRINPQTAGKVAKQFQRMAGIETSTHQGIRLW